MGHAKAISYDLQKDLSNDVSYTPIETHFVVKTQIPNLTPNFSFTHNSCISILNKQCKGTFCINTLKSFQRYFGGPNWCLFTFSIKVLNIWDYYTNEFPKMRMHFGSHWAKSLTFSPFVRMCFTLKYTLLASCALTFHT